MMFQLRTYVYATARTVVVVGVPVFVDYLLEYSLRWGVKSTDTYEQLRI